MKLIYSLKTLPGDATTQTIGFVTRSLSSKPINNYSIAPEYSEATVEGLKLMVYGVVLVDSEGSTDAITTYDGLTEVELTDTHPAQALETVGVQPGTYTTVKLEFANEYYIKAYAYNSSKGLTYYSTTSGVTTYQGQVTDSSQLPEDYDYIHYDFIVT